MSIHNFSLSSLNVYFLLSAARIIPKRNEDVEDAKIVSTRFVNAADDSSLDHKVGDWGLPRSSWLKSLVAKLIKFIIFCVLYFQIFIKNTVDLNIL